MYLKKIILNNFRNYENQEINFIKGINFFEGNNAQGKTNIIESIYMCAFGKSYRTIKDIETVKFNTDFCRINLEYNKDNINKEIELYIDKSSRKQIKKDGIKVTKIADHVGEIPLVIFSPDSLNIVKDFCTRAIWIDEGKMKADGNPEEVIKEYLDLRG